MDREPQALVNVRPVPRKDDTFLVPVEVEEDILEALTSENGLVFDEPIRLRLIRHSTYGNTLLVEPK